MLQEFLPELLGQSRENVVNAESSYRRHGRKPFVAKVVSQDDHHQHRQCKQPNQFEQMHAMLIEAEQSTSGQIEPENPGRFEVPKIDVKAGTPIKSHRVEQKKPLIPTERKFQLDDAGDDDDQESADVPSRFGQSKSGIFAAGRSFNADRGACIS